MESLKKAASGYVEVLQKGIEDRYTSAYRKVTRKRQKKKPSKMVTRQGIEPWTS